METKLKATTFRTHWLGMARIAKAAITLLAFSLTISTALAQVRNSTITGTVTDSTGAVVIPRGSNAQVIIKSATKARRVCRSTGHPRV